MQPSEFKFCKCGRPAEGKYKCTRTHKDEVKRKKVGRYSGYSKAFEQNHGTEVAEDD